MLKQVLEVYDVLDRGCVNGLDVIQLFEKFPFVEARTVSVQGEEGTTDFVKVIIQGKNGKLNGGAAPTLGIIGRLGGIGARPSKIGIVSDADGAVAALSAALKLAHMSLYGDRLVSDVIVTTHICPNAPTEPHDPVDFMGSPVDMEQMNAYEVCQDMDAVLSIDTTKGNKILNTKGFSISPTVKEGYILKVSQDLLNCMEITSGQKTNVFPLSQQDITPYANNLYHLNSILQPATATNVAVVGVAITSETAVPGCATGASHEVDIAEAAKFAIEVAKGYGENKIHFYDEDEFGKMVSLYGRMNHFQKA
ncbi:MAG: DUF1177 domain-containing protein [Breznakia sp.]